jgi:hypothetical protein
MGSIGLIDPISPIQECHSPFFETIIAAVSDDSSDDLTVDNQFLHIAKDVAMAKLWTETSGDAMARALRRLEMNMLVETRLQGRLANRPGIS